MGMSSNQCTQAPRGVVTERGNIMSPRYDWWGVQAIHPHKKDPFDVYVNRFPTEEKAREIMASLANEGYEYINLIKPEYLKG